MTSMTLSKRIEKLERQIELLQKQAKSNEENKFREHVASTLAHADFKHLDNKYTIEKHWARVKHEVASQRYYRMADAMIEMFGANNVR